VHLESDAFFHFVTGGHLEPWTAGSHAQNVVVMDAVAAAAATYAGAGYFTVIDGILSPRWFYPPVRESLISQGRRVAYAILRPQVEVAIRRASERSPGRLADPAVIRKLWADFDALDPSLDPHILDTTLQTPEETAGHISRRLRSGALDV
jgi:Chloramphenicol phosphotransferase-like protein